VTSARERRALAAVAVALASLCTGGLVACSGSGAAGDLGGPEGGGLDAGPDLPPVRDRVVSDAPDAADAPAGSDPGSADATDTDAGSDGDVPDVVIPDYSPLVVPSGQGPVLASVQLVTISFTGFSHETELATFGAWLVTSDWLTTVGSEYGVGPGTHQHFVLDDPLPATADLFFTGDLIERHIADGSLPAAASTGVDPTTGAAVDTEHLYLVIYPPSTGTTDFVGGQHFATTLGSSPAGGVTIAYAHVFAGQDLPGGPDQLTRYQTIIGHEFIEALTNPFASGWAGGAAGLLVPLAGAFETVSELADLCAMSGSIVDSGYTLPRSWSNAASLAGLDPCVPAPDGEVYFTVHGPGAAVTAPEGSTIELQLVGYATAPRGRWTLTASRWNTSGSFDLSPVLGRPDVGPGETALLTLQVPPGAKAAGGVGWVVVSSADPDSPRTHDWPVEVVVP
jgi:hypothetical protein